MLCVGAPAGTMIHTIRGASSISTSSASEPAPRAPVSLADLRDRVRVAVEGDDLVVGVASDAGDHVAAHAAEADEADLSHRVVSARRWGRPAPVRSICRYIRRAMSRCDIPVFGDIGPRFGARAVDGRGQATPPDACPPHGRRAAGAADCAHVLRRRQDLAARRRRASPSSRRPPWRPSTSCSTSEDVRTYAISEPVSAIVVNAGDGDVHLVRAGERVEVRETRH